MEQLTRQQQALVAWVIIALLVTWSIVWKFIALWKAARRDQRLWYIILTLVPPLAGAVEMFYVFFIAPRYVDLCEDNV